MTLPLPLNCKRDKEENKDADEEGERFVRAMEKEE